MYFQVYEEENLLMKVSWNENNIEVGKALVENYYGKKHIYLMPISFNEPRYLVDFNDVCIFLETRCVPRTRVDIEDLLRIKYHLKEYNPLQIAKQTHGVMYGDFVWLRFNGEEVSFSDVRIR